MIDEEKFSFRVVATSKISDKKKDRDEFLKLFDKVYNGETGSFELNISKNRTVYSVELIKKIENDSEESSSEATWEIDCDGYYPYCSNCNYAPLSVIGELPELCPKCGCKMSLLEIL